MNASGQLLIRGFALTFCVLVLAMIIGCGGPKLMGRLYYQDDVSRSTGGDSVWVYVQGREDIGATVLVKPDHTWVYQPKPSKVHRVWSETGELPPLTKPKKGEEEPVLAIEALTPSHKTLIQRVLYSRLEGQAVELEYEPLGTGGAVVDTLKPNPPPPPPRP